MQHSARFTNIEHPKSIRSENSKDKLLQKQNKYTYVYIYFKIPEPKNQMASEQKQTAFQTAATNE